MNAIRTTCPYCGVGCGISARVTGDRSVEIAGDEAHPANRGKLCSKGTHLGETVGLEGRLLHPEIGGERTDWDEAMALVAARLKNTIAEHGPDSVAFYVSGQLLTEDYYVANKLMKGFIGSANIDTNSRLCMASAVAAHGRAFGEDVVPVTYDDLEQADLILLVGSNTAWCHPVIWQRIEQARTKCGTKLVVIDPRRTETAEQADLHVAVAPDGDVALFNALLLAMREHGLIDENYLADHVAVPAGFWEQLDGSAQQAGIDADDLAALVDLVAAHPRMITLFSQGANQSVAGTDKGNAITNLHLATGRIGKPGAGPFSITGQPNAMGGREVGGLASMLAAHRGFSPPERQAIQRHWKSPVIAQQPGLKAVDMFRAAHGGQIKFLWIAGTNPAVSMPDAGFVRGALAACDFVVVSDVIAQTDTTAFADVKLPALAWGEKAGMVTNSERMMSRQRALFDAPGDARPDWWMFAEVAKRLGHGDAFTYTGPADIFREYCSQTGVDDGMARKLDLTRWADISDADFEQWQPQRWGGEAPFASGSYSTPDGKARLVAVAPAAPAIADAEFPLRLNTGRYRDQWHTMTRTGLSPRLSQHRREPLVEMHPDDAKFRGLTEGSLARVRTAQGDSLFRVALTDAQRPGELFVPMHWTDQMSSGGRADLLPGQAVDPVSGQPGFKNVAADIAPVNSEWRAFLVTRQAPILPPLLYWTKTRIAGGWLVELAGEAMVDIEALLPPGERIEAVDMRRAMRRVAVREPDGKLAAALFVTRNGDLPARDWVATQLLADDPADTSSLLAGRPREAGPDKGPTVCVCFDIGATQILNAIATQQLMSVEAVGTALNAGTNCGSCRPAIAKLLTEAEASVDMMEAAE